jgi:exopolyphosphatase/pppGpp-phosphohydrolase
MRRGRGLLFLCLVAMAGCSSTPPPSMCAIDMGSNNFRRIVGTFAEGRYVETAIDSKTMGVGDDVEQHGRISDAKLAEIEQTLRAFAAACREDGASAPVAVGTAAFRNAPNGARAIEVASNAGVRMEIASDERESELAYLVGSLGQAGHAVIDNGSRSIELVAMTGGVLQHRVFNLGYRIAYEEFFARAEEPAAAIAAFRARVLQEAEQAPFMQDQSRLVGVEFMEMAEVLFEPVPDGHSYSLAHLKERLEAIASSPAEFEQLKRTKDVDRALPRLVVAVTLMERFGYAELSLTSRQLGTGLIIEAGLPATLKPRQARP